MKKIALYSVLCALILSTLAVGCRGTNGGSGNDPVADSPLAGVWMATTFGGLKCPCECPKNPEKPHENRIQGQPYFYLTADYKAYYAIKTNLNMEELRVSKPTLSYKIEGKKVIIGTQEYNFELSNNGNNLKLTHVYGKPEIELQKVQAPTGAEIMNAEQIQ